MTGVQTCALPISIFRFGCEDIELGYRLSKFNLKVVYNAKAVSYMIRPITLNDFCKRLIKQGRSQSLYSAMYNDNEVNKWAEIIGSDEKWEEIGPLFDLKLKVALELENVVNLRIKYGFEIDEITKRLLYEAFWWTFRACKIKGIMEAKEDSQI